MTLQELARLEHLTGIRLSEEEQGIFLEYFHQMKAMFDAFVQEEGKCLVPSDFTSPLSLEPFQETKPTDPAPLLANLASGRVQERGVMIDAVF